MSALDALLARDLLPDPLIRFGIRRLVAQRLRAERGDPETVARRRSRLMAQLRRGPLAPATAEANQQHYQVPTRFFELVLGRRLKYSGAYWPAGVADLDAAEEAMLELYLERAQLADGQSILELGCGWGSLTLYMAERLPGARILAMSSSATQRAFIEEQLAARGLGNVEVVTRDINDFELDRRFDRVVSIEMFEHLRNYALLFARVASWLEPGGKLFAHVFCHRELAYAFEARGEGDWMARHFFTGGLMPAADLLPDFQAPLELEKLWLLGGEHYQRTAEAWLANLDARRDAVEPVLAEAYGRDQIRRWRAYWRVFFMACAELFGYRGGREWQVAHYRWVKPR